MLRYYQARDTPEKGGLGGNCYRYRRTIGNVCQCYAVKIYDVGLAHLRPLLSLGHV